MSEKRKQTSGKSSPLPGDYTRMVREVFTTHFDGALQALKEMKTESRFEVSGAIHSDEILLCVSLHHGEKLAATSVYASIDFDAKASAPTAEELLGTGVDAIAAVFDRLLALEKKEDQEKKAALDQLVHGSLSDLEDVPLVWTPVDLENRQVFLKVDKANPQLDAMADDWLRKHDPEFAHRESEEQSETEKLFVTGDEAKKKIRNSGRGSSGSLH